MSFKKLLFMAGAAATLAVAVWTATAEPRPASAHPLGNFSVNRLAIIDLIEPGEVRLRYIIDAAEIPTFQIMRAIDLDRDGAISSAEKHAYLNQRTAALRQNLSFQVSGKPVGLEFVAGDFELLPGQGGLDTSRLLMDLRGALPDAWLGGVDASFIDSNEFGNGGWRQVVVRPSPGINLFATSAPTEDVTSELTAYPENLLESPPNVAQASFGFRPGETALDAISEAGASVERGAANRSLGRFASLVSSQRLTPAFIALALVVAAGWGAAHALSPGHGKTIVAAYLVGARGTSRHALYLGLIVTATHTISVFALGAIAIFAESFIAADDVFFWLSLTSGVIVVCFGGALLVSRLRVLFAGGAGGGHFHHPDDHGHGHEHDHDSHSAGHHHPHALPAVEGRGLVALGVAGGIVPCPTALVVMLGSIALEQTIYGLVLVTAFSAGLAGVLTGVGLVMVHGRRLLSAPAARLASSHVAFLNRMTAASPILSALAIIAAGMLFTAQAVH